MSAHSVSPPTAGTSTARRIEPSDGHSRQVTSLCQTFSQPTDFVVLGEAHDLGRRRRPGRERRRDERVRTRARPSAGRAPGAAAASRCWLAEEQHLPLEQRPVELGERARRRAARRRSMPSISAPIVGRHGSQREPGVRRVDPAGRGARGDPRAAARAGGTASARSVMVMGSWDAPSGGIGARRRRR